MKTKLTLTLEKSTIEKENSYKSPEQIAVSRLLTLLKDAPTNAELDDKALRIQYLTRKYS
jgi:hypothetical protein